MFPHDNLAILFSDILCFHERITSHDIKTNTQLANFNNNMYYVNNSEYGKIVEHVFEKIGDTPSKFSMFYNTKTNSIDFVKALYPFQTEQKGIIKFFPKFLSQFISILPGVYFENSTFFIIMGIFNNVSMHLFLEVDNNLNYKRHSNPFYFDDKCIETCISFVISDDGFPFILFNINSQYKSLKFSKSIKDFMDL